MNVAIVGMSCIFPGAPNLTAYYDNLRRGVDSIREASIERINSGWINEMETEKPLLCTRGGFIEEYANFDAVKFGVMPISVKSSEPDQLLALQVAHNALADAGYLDRPFPREKTSVILGRGAYDPAARARFDMANRGIAQVWEVLKGLVPDIDQSILDRVKDQIKEQISPPSKDGLIGLVPNLTASRIAQRMDLYGPAMCIDAACASSLLAVEHCCRDLMSGRVDMALAGGVHLVLADGFWQIFNCLGALSDSQQIRPFDRRADGLLVGEGLGMVVLKRLEDAEKDNDLIYAVIRGIGTSSDGRSATLMSPGVRGQVVAVERAWQEANMDPKTIGALEAHGTATPIGDHAELQTVAQVFGQHLKPNKQQPTIGSVKSMLGHLMPAAGIAGLIKSALSVHHAELFPTLHCEEPNPNLSNTRFRVIDRFEPWDSTNRIAGINAFGFGGINSHLVLQQHASDRRRIAPLIKTKNIISTQVISRFSASSREELVLNIKQGRESDSNGPIRAVLFDPTTERLSRLTKIVEAGKTWRGRDAMWFTENGIVSKGGKIGFIFPGVDSSFEPRALDIAEHFGEVAPMFFKPQSVIEKCFAVLEFNSTMFKIMEYLNVPSDIMAGHSMGEWSAQMAAGLTSEESFEAFRSTLDGSKMEMPDVFFVSIGCGYNTTKKAIKGLENITISHDNCPHQVILCGNREPIDVAVDRLQKMGIVCAEFSFQSGAHTPFFEKHIDYYKNKFQELDFISANVPVWSGTICGPYPESKQEIIDLSVDHLVKPVRFRELIDELYDEGVGLFVQIGTGSLCNFVSDCLREKPHVAIQSNTKDRSGMEQLARLLAELFIEGVDDLYFDKVSAKPDKTEPLKLNLKVANGFDPLDLPKRETSPNHSFDLVPDPLFQDFNLALSTLKNAQDEVLEALNGRTQNPNKPVKWEKDVHLSLEEFPELVDHSLFRLPKGWKNLFDGRPIVPLTMLIDLAIEYAKEKFPNKIAIAIEDMYSLSWLEINEKTIVHISCEFDGKDRVDVKIGEHIGCSVILADQYLRPSDIQYPELINSRPSAYTCEEIYNVGLMFHGPDYQGMHTIDAMGDDGIDGAIRVTKGRGALLDNAGQFFGYWIVDQSDMAQLAFPVAVKRIEFYGPSIAIGEEVDCKIRCKQVENDISVAQITLHHQGRLWAKVIDWQDKSLEPAVDLWSVLREPTHLLLPEISSEGLFTLADTLKTATTIKQLAGRYFNKPERDHLEAILDPRLKRSAVFRLAIAKEIARHWYKNQTGSKKYLYPIELSLVEDGIDHIVIATPKGNIISAVAQKDKFYAAYLVPSKQSGIFISSVEDDSDHVAVDELSSVEKQLIAAEEIEVGTALVTAVKGASSRCYGINESNGINDRNGDKFLISNNWVATKQIEDYLIAWTTL